MRYLENAAYLTDKYATDIEGEIVEGTTTSVLTVLCANNVVDKRFSRALY